MRKAMFAAILMLAAMIGAPAAYADTYGDFVHWVDWMARKYNMGVIYVDRQYLPGDIYAQTRGRTIVFNESYAEQPAALQSSLASDVAYGYHPGKGCTAEQIVAAHESAHVLDNITGHRADYRLIAAIDNGLTGQISGYSFTKAGDINIDEALADSMVAVECDTPTPAERALYNMLTT